MFFLRFLALRYAALVLLLALSACGRERVVLLEPKEDDLVVLNGCVVSACNYLALVKTKHTLESDFWTRILLVRYDNHPAGHAYCVWETEGTIYGYDRNSGGFPIPVYTRDPRAIAIVLSQELSKIMRQPLSVKSAEFVEPGEVKLEKYSITPTAPAAPKILSTAPFPIRALSLKSAADPFAKD
ncbi:MAG: hypothetical protein M3Z22_00465 [Verrucomicrobiota bacterium]|nr:hypothetical protein [Verrucomicrobiota bacterium]